MFGRDAEMRILDEAAHLDAPVRIDRWIVRGVAGKLVAVSVAVGALEDVVGLGTRVVVDDRDAVPQLDFVAGDADDALDDVLLGVEREVEDDDVVPRDVADRGAAIPRCRRAASVALSTSRKSPTSSVRSMLSEGMRKGCTIKARMNRAATMTIRAERMVSSRCGSTKWT